MNQSKINLDRIKNYPTRTLISRLKPAQTFLYIKLHKKNTRKLSTNLWRNKERRIGSDCLGKRRRSLWLRIAISGLERGRRGGLPRNSALALTWRSELASLTLETKPQATNGKEILLLQGVKPEEKSEAAKGIFFIKVSRFSRY